MDADRVRGQLDRILAGATFADAERASRFLRFVVERSLEGHAGEIKESVIGVEVLGRNPSFDPKTDPIVRVEAGRLRARLNSYYQNEGKGDHLLITLPKGSYMPEFSEQSSPGQLQRVRNPAVLLGAGALFGFTLGALLLFYFRRAPQHSEVLRLSILPPENTFFESFAVSPDGRKLAFTAASNGKLVLWVQSLDSLEAKPLAGTENASHSFWSPDSRSIGFFSIPNKLKTVPTAGGPTQDIAAVVMGRGGAWSPSGTIVFCPRPVGALYQVAAAGGEPKPVTSLDTARAEVAHGFPQFLPDGRHFLYLAASSRTGESSIRLGSLESSASKVLLGSDTSAAYAPYLSGHSPSLLFVHDGALMAQSFDTQRLELSGERTVVIPQVRYVRWQQAGVSVSGNGVLLYQSGSAEDRQFGWFDRQGRLLAAIGPRNNYSSFTLSPDERRVAIQRFDDPDTVYPTIWMMDLRREGAISRFTDTGVGEPEFLPAWSPNSSEVVYSQGDDVRMRLIREPVNGGSGRVVLNTKGPKFLTDWSPDGRFVAYNSQWPDYQYLHTWIATLGEQPEEPRPFLQHSLDEGSASFSPTEGQGAPRWIAYTSDETGRPEVYVRDFSTGTGKWQVSNHGGLLPHWRRDGRELFFLTPEGTLMAVSVNPGSTFEFGTPQTLFATGFRPLPLNVWFDQYAVAGDGRRFLLDHLAPQTTPRPITAVIPR